MITSKEIHDMIQTFKVDDTDGKCIERLLGLIQSQQQRMDGLEGYLLSLQHQAAESLGRVNRMIDLLEKKGGK